MNKVTLTIGATPTAPAWTAEGTLVFERNDEGWHIRIYRGPYGTAIIERLRGRRCKPATWTTDRTPEQWVEVQRDSKKYTAV